MPGEKSHDCKLTLQEEIRLAMFECSDRFLAELNARFSALEEIATVFKCIQVDNLLFATHDDLTPAVTELVNSYDEISKEKLLEEIPRFRRRLNATKTTNDEVKGWTSLQVLQFIVHWDFVESLPNLALTLKLFLTVCVSVASCERSFSKLKLIKNYLRSKMSQDRLCDLSLLSIEREFVENIDFDEVIDKFATVKARRVMF